MKRSVEQGLLKKAKSMKGIENAVIIPADTIVTEEWVRLKCQYGCSEYGQSFTCPPHSPTPQETARMLGSYSSGLLLHSHDWQHIRRAACKLEREAFLMGLHKVFAMSCGPCDLCSSCTLEEEGCRYPDKARPSLEACGVDVFSTVRANGFSINVLKSEHEQADYFGIVMLE
ncbi:MAG: DUF2284 domain-containing protein [bacterium]